MSNPIALIACWIVYLPALSALQCASGCSPEETGCPRVGACCQDEELALDECCRWEPMESRSMTWLAGIWGTSNHRMFAVGAYGSIQGYDGKEWKIINTVGNPFLRYDLLTVVGVGEVVIAAGTGSAMIVSYTADRFGQIASDPDCGTYFDSWAIGHLEGDEFYFACSNGGVVQVKIDHLAGTITWSTLDTRGVYYPTSVVAASSTDLTVVGADGVVLEYDGLDWQASYPLGGQYFTKIFLHLGVRYIVGENGILLRERYGGWEIIDTDTTRDLQSIWVGWSEPHRKACAYMVGEHGTILLMDQGAPRPMQSGTTEQLNDVWGFTCHDVYAVGGSGTILRLTCREQEL